MSGKTVLRAEFQDPYRRETQKTLFHHWLKKKYCDWWKDGVQTAHANVHQTI